MNRVKTFIKNHQHEIFDVAVGAVIGVSCLAALKEHHESVLNKKMLTNIVAAIESSGGKLMWDDGNMVVIPPK